MSNDMNGTKFKKFIVLKIICCLIYGATTAYMINALIGLNNSESVEALGAVIAFLIYLVYGGIAYILEIVLSIIGIIASSVRLKRGECRLSSLIMFIILAILPVVTWAASIGVCSLVGK